MAGGFRYRDWAVIILAASTVVAGQSRHRSDSGAFADGVSGCSGADLLRTSICVVLVANRSGSRFKSLSMGLVQVADSTPVLFDANAKAGFRNASANAP